VVKKSKSQQAVKSVIRDKAITSSSLGSSKLAHALGKCFHQAAALSLALAREELINI